MCQGELNSPLAEVVVNNISHVELNCTCAQLTAQCTGWSVVQLLLVQAAVTLVWQHSPDQQPLPLSSLLAPIMGVVQTDMYRRPKLQMQVQLHDAV